MSAVVAQPPRMSVEEFLDWSDGRDGNFELDDGVVIAMASERIVHSRAKGAVYTALVRAVAKAGLPCEAFMEGPGVLTDDATSYQPDGLAQGGPRMPGNARTIDHPVIVVEILPPSTAYRDLGRNARNYFRVPSIAHYLIVDADDRVVTHNRLGDHGVILSKDHTGGELVLDPPGLTVTVANLLPRPDEDVVE